MGNFGDKRNAEGYYDPTPYEAINNGINPGEIWSYMGGDALIISNQGMYCNMLRLQREERPEYIEVGGLYTDPGKLSYALNERLGMYQGRITPAEFETVKASVEHALGVGTNEASNAYAQNTQEVISLKAELDHMACRLKKADDIALKHEVRLKEAESEVDKYRIQLDLMKSMYADLMEKFLQRA